MAPFSLPLFPLPNVVLFPHVFLPLHIFEPRYRQMVGDALAGDRIIGMVMLRPGYDADYEGRPPIFETGCSGLITHAEQLEDGRFNLILKGLEKFVVRGEEEPLPGQLYRRALVAPVDESLKPAEREPMKMERQRLEQLLAPLLSGGLDRHLPASMPAEDLINALAQYLEFDPLEKLALLACEGPLARCRSLVELLEMKAMASGTGTIH